MTEEAMGRIKEALQNIIYARTRLSNLQMGFETKKHQVRVALYAQKESGERKLTEEQIRSISMVECESENKAFLEAQSDYDNAKELLEVLKLIASN